MNIIRYITNYSYIKEIYKALFSLNDRKDVNNLPKKIN